MAIDILKWISFGVGGIVFILGIVYFVMWIKYSWIRKENSQNYTGAQITQVLFEKNGVSNIEIKSSFWYAKYWNNNKTRGTYRLRPWTYSRRSIFTMMEAGRQAYATIIRDSQPKTFWLIFRLPQLISMGGALLGASLIAVGIYSFASVDYQRWLSISIGVIVLLTANSYAILRRVYLLKKHVPAMLAEHTNLMPEEIDAIRKIFNMEFFYAIGQAILNSLRTILRIMEKLDKIR